MCDAVWSLCQPQPWHYNTTQAQVYPNFLEIHPQTKCKGTQICCKHASISIETHETVLIILYSTNWMIIGLIGCIEYEQEGSKLPVMSKSWVSH